MIVTCVILRNRCLSYFQEENLEDWPQSLDEINEENSTDFNDFKVFSKSGLHFIHLNINSILPKIDELRLIAHKSRAAVIGITESKIDDSVLYGEIMIDGYIPIRSDRNRQGGGVICYIRKDISFNRIEIKSDIEHIFLDLLLPNTKPILIGVVYRPPKQAGFLYKISIALESFPNFNIHETYILGDLNINLLHNGQTVPMGIKKYRDFCSIQSLTQIIKNATRITETSSSLLDHILTNSTDKIAQSGIINVGLSDHQMIFCTRKTIKIKTGEKTRIKIRSLKNYSQEKLLQNLTNCNYPNYSNFVDVNEAYLDFVEKTCDVINGIAPIKEICIKNNTAEWIDEEILVGIRIRDKLFRKFKKSKSNIQGKH